MATLGAPDTADVDKALASWARPQRDRNSAVDILGWLLVVLEHLDKRSRSQLVGCHFTLHLEQTFQSN